MIPLSILELGRVGQGSDRRTALDEARELARHAEGGRRALLQPPIDDIERYWSPQEAAQAQQMLACRIVGGPQTVREGMQAFLERTRADELMIVSDVFDPAARRRSFELIAEVAPRNVV